MEVKMAHANHVINQWHIHFLITQNESPRKETGKFYKSNRYRQEDQERAKYTTIIESRIPTQQKHENWYSGKSEPPLIPEFDPSPSEKEWFSFSLWYNSQWIALVAFPRPWCPFHQSLYIGK